MCRKNDQHHSKCKCSQFTNEECQEIFKEFWGCGSPDVRKTFINSAVHVKETTRKRRRCERPQEEATERVTKVYSLKKNGVNEPICSIMFHSILGVSVRVVRNLTTCRNVVPDVIPKTRNQRGGRCNVDYTDDDEKFFKNFFALLPQAPSHYQRSGTSNIFIEPFAKTVSQLYEAYTRRCDEEGKYKFADKKFRSYFNDNNYSLTTLKQDYCNKCCSHDEGNLSDEDWNEQIRRKK